MDGSAGQRCGPQQSAHGADAPERQHFLPAVLPPGQGPRQNTAQKTARTHGRLGERQCSVSQRQILNNEDGYADRDCRNNGQVEQRQHTDHAEQLRIVAQQRADGNPLPGSCRRLACWLWDGQRLEK